MKKKIGVSFSEASFQNYWDWFTPEDLKEDIELVLLSHEKNNTEDIPTCDGFILTGGIDTDPSFYNGPDNYPNRPDTFKPERDCFEKEIYEYSQLNKIPVLGICRGLQLINVLEGGKLIQDLDRGNQKHRKVDSDKEHTVEANKGSLLHDVAGTTFGHVNSAHHQAVDPGAIGKNLKVNVLADDGTIEGLEFIDKTNKAFMLCVQWHPERMKQKEENPFSQKLKEQFLKEVKNR
jgi:putative glutamine amidotransferase